jgi:hypothetical protein
MDRIGLPSSHEFSYRGLASFLRNFSLKEVEAMTDRRATYGAFAELLERTESKEPRSKSKSTTDKAKKKLY